MLEWKFWVLPWVWATSVGDVGCARGSSPLELSWEVMEGDPKAGLKLGGIWDDAGKGSQGWQQGKPLPGTGVGLGSGGA